jgi:hypothetical protein
VLYEVKKTNRQLVNDFETWKRGTSRIHTYEDPLLGPCCGCTTSEASLIEQAMRYLWRKSINQSYHTHLLTQLAAAELEGAALADDVAAPEEAVLAVDVAAPEEAALAVDVAAPEEAVLAAAAAAAAAAAVERR